MVEATSLQQLNDRPETDWHDQFSRRGRTQRRDAHSRGNNIPRIGRITVARGRDAADIPLIQTFGIHDLTTFKVWTYPEEDGAMTRPHAKAEVTLISPWFSERWSRLVREREYNREH